MKSARTILFFIPVFILLAVSVVPSGAAPLYQATVTSTVTAPPAYVPTISTAPTYPSDFSCPSGPISGWGTVTPSTYWSANCSQCVVTPLWTSTAQPAATVTGTPPTATPVTSTPTPSATTTPTPIYTQSATTYTYVSFTSSYTGATMSCETYYNGLKCQFYFPTPPNARTQYSPVLTISAPSNSTAYIVSDSVATGKFWYANPDIDNYSMGLSTGTYPATGTGVSVHHTYSKSVGTSFGLTFHTSKDTNQSSFWGGTVYIQPQAVFPTPIPVTPSVTPTGTPSVYCAAVDGSTSGDSGFSWTGIEYGASACIDIGPEEISILGVDIGFPHLAHLCLQEISIGIMVIFGVTIALDVVAAILFLAFLLRNMFIS